MTLDLPPSHQRVLDRFVAACRDDPRVEAAFLGGSYARGAADSWSDLDLGVIVRDDAYEEFAAQLDAFLARLGRLLFLEDFDLPDIAFFILDDGAEGEIALGRASDFRGMHLGPFRTLVDKSGLLDGVEFEGEQPTAEEQRESVRRLVSWFWHDLSHFIAAVGRGQLWWAFGQLEALRLLCVNLLRLHYDAAARADGYDKVDAVLPADSLTPLRATCCPPEREALLAAAWRTLRLYEEIAPPLARRHGVDYPAGLARIMSMRLQALEGAHGTES